MQRRPPEHGRAVYLALACGCSCCCCCCAHTLLGVAGSLAVSAPTMARSSDPVQQAKRAGSAAYWGGTGLVAALVLAASLVMQQLPIGALGVFLCLPLVQVCGGLLALVMLAVRRIPEREIALRHVLRVMAMGVGGALGGVAVMAALYFAVVGVH